MNSINEENIKIIKKFMTERFSSYLVILFGSAVSNRMRPDSDIDIAFLSKQKTEAYDAFMLAQELAGLLGRDVDIVDLSTASSVFKAQIVGKGEIIFDSDVYASALFRMRTLKEYALLNEERQCIIDKIKGCGFLNEQ